jgi:hypothetical protein
MDAILTKPTQLNTFPEIVVMPTQVWHTEQMEDLQRTAYPGDDEYLHADEFRSHLRYFPEGQFVAIDTYTNRVIGLTASMRLDFNPADDLLETWRATTGDG